MTPRVSILIPAFNAEPTLEACLASVARQSMDDWECVIVDDGSTDGTRALAERFRKRDPRFRLFSSRHQGVVAARNVGLDHCRGEWVALLDADDLMHRRRLQRQLAALAAQPRLSAVGCHVRIFPTRTQKEGMRAYERWLSSVDSPRRVREAAFVECPIAHSTLVIRRTLLESLRYRDRGWPEDYDLVLRLLAGGHRIGVVPRRLVLWRRAPDGLSTSHPAYAIERFTACKAAFLADGFLAGATDYVLWGYGATGRMLRKALARHGKRASHVVEIHPGRLGNRIHGAPVIAPYALPALDRRPVLVSVAGAQARRLIRAAMAEFGFVELRDFVCTA